jgi:hypothetical protein
LINLLKYIFNLKKRKETHMEFAINNFYTISSYILKMKEKNVVIERIIKNILLYKKLPAININLKKE